MKGKWGEEVQILSGMMFEIKPSQKSCLYLVFSKVFRRNFSRKICQLLVVLPSGSKFLLQIAFQTDLFSLTKLMVSHDLPRSTVTNQIAFVKRDSKSISSLKRAMDRCYQALISCFFLVSKLETLDIISFNLLYCTEMIVTGTDLKDIKRSWCLKTKQ